MRGNPLAITIYASLPRISRSDNRDHHRIVGRVQSRREDVVWSPGEVLSQHGVHIVTADRHDAWIRAFARVQE